MRRAVVLCALLALAAFSSVPVRAAESRALPDDVLALVEVANPTQFDQKLQALAWRVFPGAPTGAFRQAVADWARTQDPTALDLSAPLQLVLYRGEALEKPVFIFSVVDGDRYLDALAPNLYGGEKDGDLNLYEEDPKEAAGEGVWNAGPAQPLAIAVVGNHVVLGRSAEGVRKVFALVEAGSLGAEPFFAAADAGGVVRPREMAASLAEQGEDPFQMLRDRLPSAAMATTEQEQQSSRMLNVGIDAGRDATGQIEVLRAALSLSPQAIVCTGDVQPVAAGGLAAYLATMQGGKQDLLALMPASSVAVFAGHMGNVAMLVDWYAGFLSTVAPADGSANDAMARIKDKAAEYAALLDGRFASALAISPKGSLVSVKAYGVTDAARAEAVLNSLGSLVDDVSTLQASIGSPMVTHITTKPNVATHAGHAITEWDYGIEYKEPDATTPGAPQVAALQREMMTAMYGGDLKAYSAFRDDAFVMFQGANTLGGLKAVLDGSIASAANEPRLKAAMAGMPEEPVFVGYVTLGELLGAYLKALSSAMQASGLGAPFANVRFAPAPAAGFAAAVNEGGGLEARLLIPVDALASIVNGFMQGVMGGMNIRVMP
jgi:hypothetical protein